jgi:hypothetical protein
MYGFYKSKRIVIFDTLIEGYVSETDSEKKEEQLNGIYNEPEKKVETTEKSPVKFDLKSEIIIKNLILII